MAFGRGLIGELHVLSSDRPFTFGKTYEDKNPTEDGKTFCCHPDLYSMAS